MEVGEREIIHLSLHCHHQNDFSKDNVEKYVLL